MGSSEDALYFQTRYNGLSVGHYLRYPWQRHHVKGTQIFQSTMPTKVMV